MGHFFCYDKNLAMYIQSRGIRSVTTALSPSSMKKFTLFVKSDKLNSVINEFENMKKTNQLGG